MDGHAVSVINFDHRKMLDLHRLGCDAEDIADHLDVRPETVRKNLDKYFSQALDHQRLMAALNTEISRFDKLHQTFWDSALEKNVDAAKMILSISDRRSKMLGLNAPDKLQVEFNQYEEMSDEEIKAKIATIEADMVDITPTGADAIDKTGDTVNA